MRIAYTPTLAEHFRATAELSRVTPIFDGVGAVPHFLACLLLANVMTQLATGGTPGAAPIMVLAAPLLFLVGLRHARAREGLGGEITVELGADRIDVRQPRHRWVIPWARVERVEETPEFFLVATSRAGFYLPKRALERAEGIAELRNALHAREA